jgi:valyl-tRNA synthetase
MLKNPKCLEKGPKEKVETEQEKHAKYEAMLKEVEGRLAAL